MIYYMFIFTITFVIGCFEINSMWENVCVCVFVYFESWDVGV